MGSRYFDKIKKNLECQIKCKNGVGDKPDLWGVDNFDKIKKRKN